MGFFIDAQWPKIVVGLGGGHYHCAPMASEYERVTKSLVIQTQVWVSDRSPSLELERG